jgi:hypothetical protein
MIDLNLDANELISVNSKCLSMEVMDSLDNENYIIYYSSLWEDNIYQKWLISFKNNYPGKNIRIDEKESFISSSFSERDAESLFNKFNNNKQEKETGSMNLKPLMIENTNTEKDEQLTMLSNLLAKYGKEATLADIVLKERPIGEVRFKFPCDTMYTFDTQDISWKDEVDKSNDSSWLTIPQAIETYFKELTICTERHDKDNNTYAKMTEMFSRISIDQIVKLFTTGLLINDVKVKPIESERPIDESELTNYISELYVMFRDEYYPFDYYINSKVRDIK